MIARFAEGQIDRFPALVDELVAYRVNVIVVFSDQAIQAAQRVGIVVVARIWSGLVRGRCSKVHGAMGDIRNRNDP